MKDSRWGGPWPQSIDQAPDQHPPQFASEQWKQLCALKAAEDNEADAKTHEKAPHSPVEGKPGAD